MLYDKGFTRQGPDGAELGLARFDTYAEFQLLIRAGDVLIPRVDFTEPLRVECQHFVDCIVNGTTPETDGHEGLRVVRALEAAQRSLDAQRSRREV
jgi:predicted dehydrogenase